MKSNDYLNGRFHRMTVRLNRTLARALNHLHQINWLRVEGGDTGELMKVVNLYSEMMQMAGFLEGYLEMHRELADTVQKEGETDGQQPARHDG